jgi:hypothetical protein
VEVFTRFSLRVGACRRSPLRPVLRRIRRFSRGYFT